jgi:hypothetical protein
VEIIYSASVILIPLANFKTKQTMKALIITLLIIEAFQIIALFSVLITDSEAYEPEDKYIHSKLDFLKFFIPFFWFIPMVNMILKWWNKLK